MPEFKLPRDGEIYTAAIIARCRQLISTRIWTGLNVTTFDSWLGNFAGPLERYFAACLLDVLVYRSEGQTTALMREVISRSIPEVVPSFGGQSALEVLSGTADPGIRIVPVIRQSDPPTKSGPLLARMYRRRLQLNDKWMIWPWQARKYMKMKKGSIIYIDDLLGTGTQFMSFLKHFGLLEEKAASQIYAPLTAHSKGVGHLARNAGHVTIAAAEWLGDEYDLFGSGSSAFVDGENDPATARKFYLGLLKSRGLPVPKSYVFGWGKLGLSYAFEHAVPNNSLPIYWFGHEHWKPLFWR